MKKKIIMIILIVAIVVVATYFIVINKSPEEPKISYYSPGDFFVTNIKDSTRLLKTTIVIELTKENEDEYLTKNNHVIRDVVVFTLREKTEEELRSTGFQDELRSEIVSMLTEKMEIDCIQTIYFNDYVIQ